MRGPASDWIVLLLGGASGVGKSMLSYRLARRLGVNLTEIDDLQIALETATEPRDLPLLHFWRTNFDEYMSWIDDQRVEHHVRVCREVFVPVMRAVIADHLETRTPVVYEGDFLLPEMATMATYGDEPNDSRVRALFVSEPDEAQLAANYISREGGAGPERARASSLFDAFLRSECDRYGVPSVDARPWDSVVERASVFAMIAGSGADCVDRRRSRDVPGRGARVAGRRRLRRGG